MRSVSAASLALIVEPYVRMCTEDHVARAIYNALGRVSGAVIQNLVNGFICVLCGGGLSGGVILAVAISFLKNFASLPPFLAL